jgi:hypothetical protein
VKSLVSPDIIWDYFAPAGPVSGQALSTRGVLRLGRRSGVELTDCPLSVNRAFEFYRVCVLVRRFSDGVCERVRLPPPDPHRQIFYRVRG